MNHIEAMSVNLKQAEAILQIYMEAKLTCMLHSSPGMGKSSLIKQVAKKYNLYLVDIRLSTYDPTMLNGFPMHGKDETGAPTGKAQFLPVENFILEGDNIPLNPETGKPYDGVLLFLDEFNQAPRMVQAASYRVMLDREIGDKKLHPNTVIVGAGNLVTDNAHANPMGTALQSRMAHIFIRNDMELLMEYAREKVWDHRVIAWARSKGVMPDFDPHHNDCSFLCARTMEMLSDAVKNIRTEDMYELAQVPQGVVGAGHGTDFVSFTEVYKDLVTVEDIVKDPQAANLPTSSNARWATVFMLSSKMQSGAKSVKPIMEYMDRMDAEFAALFFQDCIKRNITIIQDKNFDAMVNQWQRAGKI